MKVPTPLEVMAHAEKRLKACHRGVLCHVVRAEGSTPGSPGWKLFVGIDDEPFGNLGGGAFEALVRADALEMLAGRDSPSRLERYYLTEKAAKGKPTGMACGGMVEVFLEVLARPPVLVISGGGPVGQALAAQAALCDFDLAVADDRPQFSRPELFPDGARILNVSRDYSGGFLEDLSSRTLYVAVVSRCWQTDLAACRAVLNQPPEDLCYLGLMGSHRKIERIRMELEAENLSLEGVPFFAPIGIAIGGATPAEIAVSIVAELVRERRRLESSAGVKATPMRLA